MPVPPRKKPEKTDSKERVQTILLWGVVVCGIAAIIWMIAVNPKEKRLVCDTSVRPSLIGFGSCTEE